MIKFSILLVICLTSCITQYNYKLVWEDNFSIDGLPSSKFWDYDQGGTGWGNNEEQYYTKADIQNSFVKDGNLTIRAKENLGQLPAGTFGFYKDYTSARLVTRNFVSLKYGRVEVRAKLPKGRGLWPAIWMLPLLNTYGDWPSSGEIDIMEYVGFEPNNIYQTIHTRSFNHIAGTQKSMKSSFTDLAEDFHTYSMDWTPQGIQFFIDDIKRYEFKNTYDGDSEWPFDKPFYLILNLAVGGNWGGMEGVDKSVFPQDFVIDFVRLYQVQ